MRRSRKFCERGSIFYKVFFFFFFFLLIDEGIEDPNTAINGPLSASDIPFKCRFICRLMMVQH